MLGPSIIFLTNHISPSLTVSSCQQPPAKHMLGSSLSLKAIYLLPYVFRLKIQIQKTGSSILWFSTQKLKPRARNSIQTSQVGNREPSPQVLTHHLAGACTKQEAGIQGQARTCVLAFQIRDAGGSSSILAAAPSTCPCKDHLNVQAVP